MSACDSQWRDLFANHQVDCWSDERILEELRRRLETTFKMGPILQKNSVTIRSQVNETMQYGNLFLVGDAAHIASPTGAKRFNLAAVDSFSLACALTAYYGEQRTDFLNCYTETCLQRIWHVEYFSWWIICLLHHFP